VNILFVLYYDFTVNSAGHVRCLANELTQLGNDCCVAVPDGMSSPHPAGRVRFRLVEYDDVLRRDFCFADGRGPDIIHAWTPREIVRRFCDRVRQLYRCRLFVHMEDNEWHILSCALGQPFEELAFLDTEELDKRVSVFWSHPHRAMRFLQEADGVTVIIDRLRELLPPVKSVLELWPSADRELFHPQPRLELERQALGIAKNSTVLVYTGNVHAANAHEVRSLYLAVAILNREGHAATLVRSGADHHPFLGSDEGWGRRYSIELGPVRHTEIPRLLGLADVLVQPGKPDAFNDYRFPSKLPEFLSVGRPVILPDTNIARHMTHRKHGFIVPDLHAVAIADAVREIMSDQTLYRTLSSGAVEFFKRRLSWAKSGRLLLDFYLSRAIEAGTGPVIAGDTVSTNALRRLS
jgi:glycosyltransferase involved in cell wall biosynthesis